LFLVFVLVVGSAAPAADSVYRWLAPPFLAFVLLTYLSFFADNRDPVRYRWALQALRDRNWFEVASAVPWWLISTIFAAVSALAIAWSLPEGIGVEPNRAPTPAIGMFLMAAGHPSASLALVILFMLRDLLVMLWLSCSPWRSKADVAGIIYLALVYWPLAAILWITGMPHLLPVVAPIATGNAGTDFVPIGIELAFAMFLFYARWREITRLKPT
jgi:hypothetical protein